MTYKNEALNDIATQLLDDWGLSIDEIKNFAADLPGECEAIEQDRNEAAWERQQQSLMESGGPDDSSYRRDMIDAGRGHLLR